MFGFGHRYATSETVTLKKYTVLKKVDRPFAETEVQITQAAHDLAQMSNLFCVPQIIEYDRDSGVIEFERIQGFITIGQFLAKKPDNITILRRVGKVLAHIHDRLCIPLDVCRLADARWLSIGGDVVPMHGDFNTINVGYKKDSDAIVVLDWASPTSLGPRSTVGPRYLELAHFIYSLCIHQANFLKSLRLLRQRANAFLEGYEAELGRQIDLSIISDFLLRISFVSFPVHDEYKNVLKRLYYTGICSVGHVMFKALSREWQQNPSLQSEQTL